MKDQLKPFTHKPEYSWGKNRIKGTQDKTNNDDGFSYSKRRKYWYGRKWQGVVLE